MIIYQSFSRCFPVTIYLNPTTTSLIPNFGNILEAMQTVHDALLQTTLRTEQKTDARSEVAWVIECIKAMSGKFVDAPTSQRAPQPQRNYDRIR